MKGLVSLVLNDLLKWLGSRAYSILARGDSQGLRAGSSVGLSTYLTT